MVVRCLGTILLKATMPFGLCEESEGKTGKRKTEDGGGVHDVKSGQRAGRGRARSGDMGAVCPEWLGHIYPSSGGGCHSSDSALTTTMLRGGTAQCDCTLVCAAFSSRTLKQKAE